MNTYAIIQSGGKQYRVSEGDTLRVEKLIANKGEDVTLNVLFAKKDTQSLFGQPNVKGAVVTAQVVRQFKAPKIIIFHQRQKKVYKKTNGHRQQLTELKIKQITLP